MSISLHTARDTGRYTARALAYEELKAAILQGRIPLGARLREERLADRLGVSRTPAREALLRLHAERFLDRHPDGGFRVATPSVHAMQELYEVRRALERFGLRRGFETGGHDHEVLELLRDEWLAHERERDTGRPDAEFVLVDEAFHGSLADAAGNRRLAEELRHVNELIRTVRTQDFVREGRIAATIEQHLAILDAVLGGDRTAATELLDRHILESQAVVEEAVGRALAQALVAAEELPWWP